MAAEVGVPHIVLWDITKFGNIVSEDKRVIQQHRQVHSNQAVQGECC